MIYRLLPALFLLPIVASCNRDDEGNPPRHAEEPSSVSFTYDGQPVAYGVIKRTYSTGPNGEQLFAPVVKYWLDRNLGAQQAAAYPNDPLARGDLFQWGRQADGH